MDGEKSGYEGSGIFNYIEQEKSGSSHSTRVPHALAIAASMVIVLAGIKAASGLLGPILLALFLAIVLLVPLRWLQKHGCPQFLAFLFVLICTITLFVGITYFVGSSLNDFIGKIPRYKDRVVDRYREIEVLIGKWGFQFGASEKSSLTQQASTEPAETEPNKSKPIPHAPVPNKIPPNTVPLPLVPLLPEGVETASDDLLAGDDDIPALSEEEKKEWKEKAEKVEELPSLISLDLQVVALWITRAMLYVQKMLEGGFLVLIFTIFMLFEASFFHEKVNRAFGKNGPIRIEHFHRIAEDVRRYLFLKTLANLMSGSAAMFVYFMFDVPAALFWGIVAFFMYYIPNIGGTLAAVIPGILIFMVHDIPGVLLYAVCLVTLECTIAYGIEPKMLGHGLRLSTMVIILTLFFWGFLLGPIGLFLAAPLTVMIKIILQAFPETRWLAVFLEGSREKLH